MVKNPEVTIIMATFNRARYISAALESIIQQSFTDWECIIIDDGSTDRTQDVVNRFLNQEPRLRYYKRNKDYKKGLPGCRNFGIDLAKGRYIVFFDDDDIVHPDNLGMCVNVLQTNRKDYCRYLRKTFYGDFKEEFDRNRDVEIHNLEGNVLEDMLTERLPFNSCQVMWKKECFEENYFNESLMYAEEWECYSRILMSGVEGLNLKKVLFFGRKHSQSNTGEFYQNSSLRLESHSRAIQMVIKNLNKQQRFSENLVKFFLRVGLAKEDFEIIRSVLQNSKAGFLKRCKYHLGFIAYPLLKPLFRIKSKIQKI